MKKTEQNVFSRHPEQRYPPQRRHLSQACATALCGLGVKGKLRLDANNSAMILPGPGTFAHIHLVFR